MEQPISAAGVVKAANNLQQSDAFAELQRALNTQPDDAPNGDPVQFAAQSLVDIISGIKIQQSSDAAFLAHQQFITLANNELSDIRNEMLMAVNKVLDGADALSEAIEQLPDDVKSAAMDNVATIYEACSFQDITGQRIQNLLKAVSEIEEAMASHVLNFTDGDEAGAGSDDPSDAASDQGQASNASGIIRDEDLLNGPAHSADAPNQDDIDRLFDELPASKA